MLAAEFLAEIVVHAPVQVAVELREGISIGDARVSQCRQLDGVAVAASGSRQRGGDLVRRPGGYQGERRPYNRVKGEQIESGRRAILIADLERGVHLIGQAPLQLIQIARVLFWSSSRSPT